MNPSVRDLTATQRDSPTQHPRPYWLAACCVRPRPCTSSGRSAQWVDERGIHGTRQTRAMERVSSTARCQMEQLQRDAQPTESWSVDPNGAGVPCCKLAGGLMRSSVVGRVGSTPPARRCWPFVFKPSARLDVGLFSSPPLHLSLSAHSLLPHAVEHGVLDLMSC